MCGYIEKLSIHTVINKIWLSVLIFTSGVSGNLHWNTSRVEAEERPL